MPFLPTEKGPSRDSTGAEQETTVVASSSPNPFDEAALLAGAREKTGLS
jgi:hypothetical protein